MRSLLRGYGPLKLYAVVRSIHCQLTLRTKHGFHLMAIQIFEITDPDWQIITN